MRVIITGGTGQIGRALSRELIDASHDVIVLSRRPGGATGLADGVQVVPWDAQSAKGWGHLVDGDTAIVNLAGANLAGTSFFPSRWTAERKRLNLQSRLDAGQAVIAAVEKARIKPFVVVQSSAIGHYGVRGDEVFTEDDGAGEDYMARITVDWEGSTASVESQGVRRVVIRTAVVLDPREGALWRLLLPYRLFVGGPMGSGRQGFSWIHPADEVAAIRFLIENDQTSGAYNLCAPEPLTNAEFGNVLGQVLRRPSWFPIPAFALRLAFGEVVTTVLEGQRAMPKRLLETGFDFRFPTAEAALRDLLGKD